MNISFCTVVLSLIQGIALNTDVPPCSQGWGVTAENDRTADWRYSSRCKAHGKAVAHGIL
jgi:hypothetical protein